ncbi:E3 ubiquitin-protein ligase RNF135 isoform X5 [Pogona vitticeps]
MAIAARAPHLEKKLQEELTCSLCLDVFNTPVLIAKCSHNFCKKCISQHCQKARDKAFCPECRGELRLNGLIDNRSLANIVDVFHQMKKTQITWARKQELCWEQLDPSWTQYKKASGTAGLAYGLKDVMKISELPQQIEATLKAIASWKKDDTEMKNTSLEQEVCIENPIKMTDVALAVEKIKSITYVVEEFRRQLEKSVLWNRPVKLPQESTLGKHQNNEIQKEAEVEMASSSISTQSQDSLQEASSSSSAMSSITEDDILSVNLSTCGTPLDCSQHERRRSRPAIHRADSIISSQFSQWAANVTLDLKTLNDRLELSEDKKKVTVSDFFVGYEHSAQRFCVSQVLGCQGFSDGCHYWEVITEDATGWAIGIAYKEIGKRDKLGRTELSWCVEWSVERLSAWHGDRETHIGNRKPLRVGVFLDIPESCLSFYSLTDQETCLHKFEIHVANPVYPAFWIFGMNAGECLTIAKSGTSPL